MLVSEQFPTSDLTKALSRVAGNRHSDGISSIVSADDRSVIINGFYEMMVAIRTQCPLHEKQGMKVKELEWIASRMSDNSFIAQNGFGENYVAYLTRDEFWRCICKDFPTLEAAKAAAQADYEARILSAIETSALEPSPRAQALEEAAQALEAWGDIYGDNAAKCVRALSSQPVADHIADAGKMVADGWQSDLRGLKIALEQAWESNRDRQNEIVRLKDALCNFTDGRDISYVEALGIARSLTGGQP